MQVIARIFTSLKRDTDDDKQETRDDTLNTFHCFLLASGHHVLENGSNSFDMKDFRWCECISKIELNKLSKSSWIVCITLDQDAGLLGNIDDHNNLIQSFRSIILALLFEVDSFREDLVSGNVDIDLEKVKIIIN